MAASHLSSKMSMISDDEAKPTMLPMFALAVQKPMADPSVLRLKYSLVMVKRVGQDRHWKNPNVMRPTTRTTFCHHYLSAAMLPQTRETAGMLRKPMMDTIVKMRYELRLTCFLVIRNLRPKPRASEA